MNHLAKIKKLKTNHFSRLNIAIFGIVFAVIGGYVLYLSFAAVPGAVGTCEYQSSWGTRQPSMETDLLNAINADRTSRGFSKLTLAPALSRTAQWKAMDEAGFMYMQHDDPAGDVPGAPNGRTISDRFVACGYPYNAAWGENLAYGLLTSQDAENAFMSEPDNCSQGVISHRCNILNPVYTYAGVGVATAGNGLNFYVEDFGTTAQDVYADSTPPSIPTNLTATTVSQTTINLSWNASTDSGGGKPGYDIYINGGSTPYATLGDGVNGGITAAPIQNLICGTTYTFGVDAFDAGGNHSAQATVTKATAACSGGGDSQAPSKPTNLAVVNKTQTSVSLSWTASTDDVGVTGYDLYNNGLPAGSTTTTSDTITGLTCGTTYSLGVGAHDAAGNKSIIATKSVTTPSCPVGGLPGDCNGDGKVELLDLSSVLGNWNTNFPACDFDKSGTVDLLDLSTVLGNWTG